MTDKEGLISLRKCDAPHAESQPDYEDNQPSTSSTSKPADTYKAADAKENKSAPVDKKPADGAPSLSAPTIYQKFVSSFNAVLQNLVNDEVPRPILSQFNIDGIGAYIKEEQPRNVVFMVGAGISTSAGIPDFRSPGTGLYSNLQKFNLPNPEVVFDISFFNENPEPFFILAKDLFHENIKPTLSHHLIRLFDKKEMLRRCFTQNIDALEYAAGVSEERVVTAHGSHQTSTCRNNSCKKKYNKQWLMSHLKDKEKIFAKCDACGSVVKPDIVFFGEKLSKRFFSTALADLPKCDLLIIMGTSLVVQPFASLVQQVSRKCPRLLINLEPVGTEASGSLYNDGESGPLKYDRDGNRQDVFWRGTCDDGALKLARILGWEDELKALAKADPKTA